MAKWLTLFEVLWKCDLVTLSKICLRLCPSAYLSINLGINLIISRIPWGISKILFVLGSYESLAMRDGKTKQGLFSTIQYCKITVWLAIWGRIKWHYLFLYSNENTGVSINQTRYFVCILDWHRKLFRLALNCQFKKICRNAF